MTIEAFSGKTLQTCISLIRELKNEGIESPDDQIAFIEKYFSDNQEALTKIDFDKYEKLLLEKRKKRAKMEADLVNHKMKISVGHVQCPICNRGNLRIVHTQGVTYTECPKCTFSKEFA